MSDEGRAQTPESTPAGPGREAEEPAVDGEAVPSPDDDRNLNPSSEGDGPADPSAVDADLRELLADAEQKKDEYLELARRTQADFDNYRKRMAAEVRASAVRGKAELAAGLIGVVDNLERALEAAGIEEGAEASSDDPVAQGIVLTHRELRATLERSGVEAYSPAGERFDPTWHEALQKMPVDGHEPGTVVEVMQKGYRLGDQVLRAARVVVSE